MAPEKPNPRRIVAEDKKQNCKNYQAGKKQSPAIGKFAVIFQEPSDKKGTQNTDVENSNINCHDREAQHTGVCVEENWNQCQPNQRPNGECYWNRTLFRQFEKEKKHKNQHWKEKKLHVLPGGFIPWCKKPYDGIVTGPFIDEM